MDHPVALVAEAVVAEGELVVDPGLEVLDHGPEVRLALAEAPEVEDGVDALAGHDVVEGQEPLRQIEKHRQDLVGAARDDAEAELVVDRRRRRVGLGQELGVERVLVLPPADELGDGEARREHPADDPVDLLLDQVEHVLVGHRDGEEKLASIEVMDDVHRLEDGAGAELPVPFARGEHEHLLDGGAGDGAGDRELEVPAQVGDRLVLDALEAGTIRGLVRVEFLRLEEGAGLRDVFQVEPVPVDDRVAAEDEPDRLELHQGELVEPLEPTDGRVLGHERERINLRDA